MGNERMWYLTDCFCSGGNCMFFGMFTAYVSWISSDAYHNEIAHNHSHCFLSNVQCIQEELLANTSHTAINSKVIYDSFFLRDDTFLNPVFFITDLQCWTMKCRCTFLFATSNMHQILTVECLHLCYCTQTYNDIAQAWLCGQALLFQNLKHKTYLTVSAAQICLVSTESRHVYVFLLVSCHSYQNDHVYCVHHRCQPLIKVKVR